MQRFILGSQSPRRREILTSFSLLFEHVSPNFDEDAIPFSGHPGEFACMLSKGKMDSLSHQFMDSVILTADTIVYLDGKSYAKPQNDEHAFAIISALSGHWHSVYTGVSVKGNHQEFHQWEETRVLFNTLTPNQIKQYVETQRWQDKAGGYGVQLAGGLLIKKIEGCFYNVTGLPMNTVYHLFSRLGIDLWNYLKAQ